jgi:hypothetical protein
MLVAAVGLTTVAALYGLLHFGTELADYLMDRKWKWHRLHWYRRPHGLQGIPVGQPFTESRPRQCD